MGHHAKNLLQQVSTVQAIAPQSVNAAATVNGAVTNRIGFMSLVATCDTGAFTSTVANVTYYLQTGNNANGSDMANVSVIDPITSGANTLPSVIITTANTNGAFGCDLTTLYQYVRVVGTVNGGTSSLIGADLVLYGDYYEPPNVGLQDTPYGKLNS